MAQAKRTIRDADYRPMIHDLPTAERPREQLRDRGPASLSNAELLAILLRTGTRAQSALDMAVRLLAQYQGLDGLARAGFAELAHSHGVGEAKAAQLHAALELAKRLSTLQGPERPTIHSPQDVADLLMAEMSLLDQEHFRVLVLNTKNQVMATPTVFVGRVNTTTVRIAEVFKEAVRQNCPALIVVHNHPSGDPTPSPEDVTVTQDLVAAGKALDIEVLDHVVIGRQQFVSLKEKGLGF